MNYEQEQQFAAEVKRYVTEHLPLSQISDSELQQQIEDIVEQRIGAGYCSIEQRVSIVEQVYSSIRGFGLLDSIIKDDTITEVMINGPENVFIEQNGRLFKLDKQFESQRKLEDTVAADENESEIVRLELLELSRSALQQYATKFKGDGISQADMMQMYDQVERTVTGISATADTTEHKKEATVSLLADTKKAIETAYATKGGKQA